MFDIVDTPFSYERGLQLDFRITAGQRDLQNGVQDQVEGKEEGRKEDGEMT